MKNHSNPQSRSKPNNLVQTIERVSLILDILGKSAQGISVGELSTRVGFPKGTTHRLLSSLAYFDYVRKDSTTKNYYLGFKLAELGNRLLNQLDFRTAARPYLINLAERAKETVHMVILDEKEVLYVDKLDSSEHCSSLRMVSMLGARMPAHCTAVGKVLLSNLSEEKLVEIGNNSLLTRKTVNTITNPDRLMEHLELVRTRGYAFDDEENEEGIRCVAAPIQNETGQVVAAISISVPTIRTAKERLETTLKDQVTETALKISRRLGFRDDME